METFTDMKTTKRQNRATDQVEIHTENKTTITQQKLQDINNVEIAHKSLAREE